MVITMGVMSKDRQWLPRSDHNRVSWSFAFAVIAGFFTVICLFGLVTHYLSVESRIMMEDPSVRQKLLGSETKYGYAKSISGFEAGAGTESRLGGVPSLFTMPVTGSQLAPGSAGVGAGTASHLSRATVAPGAVGATTAGTSAATVSAKLRETLEAQRAAVLAANARAIETGLPVTGAIPQSSGYSPSIYQTGVRTEPGVTGSLTRPMPHTGSMSHLQPTVAMDSTV
ncbi:unnamed protein product [Echinostoma caproni]|uniref:Uncharacterized protein n=1 Tax=Echinostoma caproni TaxID=27848 RepID=A0A183ASC0_9TREM|nr:unnamed protein product [Echinostoma caproni]